MSILNLPHAYDLVVGETFELFYRGVLNCVEPSVYDLEFDWLTGAQSGAALYPLPPPYSTTRAVEPITLI